MRALLALVIHLAVLGGVLREQPRKHLLIGEQPLATGVQRAAFLPKIALPLGVAHLKVCPRHRQRGIRVRDSRGCHRRRRARGAAPCHGCREFLTAWRVREFYIDLGTNRPKCRHPRQVPRTCFTVTRGSSGCTSLPLSGSPSVRAERRPCGGVAASAVR